MNAREAAGLIRACLKGAHTHQQGIDAFNAVGEMARSIDEQAEQIATLKTALRRAYFEAAWTGARGIEPEDIERRVAMQLAREMPEIFGEDENGGKANE